MYGPMFWESKSEQDAISYFHETLTHQQGVWHRPLAYQYRYYFSYNSWCANHEYILYHVCRVVMYYIVYHPLPPITACIRLAMHYAYLARAWHYRLLCITTHLIPFSKARKDGLWCGFLLRGMVHDRPHGAGVRSQTLTAAHNTFSSFQNRQARSFSKKEKRDHDIAETSCPWHTP